MTNDKWDGRKKEVLMRDKNLLLRYLRAFANDQN